MSDRPGIPWKNFCMCKYSFGLKREIAQAHMCIHRAKFLVRKIESMERAELASLIRVEPFGRADQ